MSVFKNFPGLENLEKTFKDFQGPARALVLVSLEANIIGYWLLGGLPGIVLTLVKNHARPESWEAFLKLLIAYQTTDTREQLRSLIPQPQQSARH